MRSGSMPTMFTAGVLSRALSLTAGTVSIRIGAMPSMSGSLPTAASNCWTVLDGMLTLRPPAAPSLFWNWTISSTWPSTSYTVLVML